ncbi:MAG: DUF6036 family nucleotidyltransferase, partial [Pirellulales bacterium]
MNDPLSRVLADAVDLLEQRGLAYALIGGFASSLRGQPRVTADVDMVIAADVDGALQLLGTLDDTPFEPLFEDTEDVVRRAFILPLRHRATGVKLDLAVGLSGFERQTMDRANVIDVAGRSVSVATAEDLIVMKALAGRPHDDQDIRGMIVAQGEHLDWQYCLAIASDLGEAVDQ